jgi:hypothetical protein
MKKYIIAAILVLGFQMAKSQVYIQRYALSNKDTVRTQVRMAIIEIATSYVDTATNNDSKVWYNKRLCQVVLAEPTAQFWVDWFIYPLAAIAQSATPTDAQVKAGVLTLWHRNTFFSTKR